MLVLTRRKNERVFIRTPHGEEIVVIVAESLGKVRLGFEADPSIEVDREEIRIEKDRKAQAESED